MTTSKMYRNLFTLCVAVFLINIHSSVDCKYVEGEISTIEDWRFITRFCFLSAKGTLTFEFEYPTSYSPQHILLYFDSADQWDAVYKSDKSCLERYAVVDTGTNQIIELDTLNYQAGCSIDVNGNYKCIGGRVFRSARERWWYVAVSHCNRSTLAATCDQKLQPLSVDNGQILELSMATGLAGCKVVTEAGVQKYVCVGGRVFKSSRERWWFIVVSRCNPLPSDSCADKVSVLNPHNNQIIYLTTTFSLSGCETQTQDGVTRFVCRSSRTFISARERWWFIAVSRCDRPLDSNCSQRLAVLRPENNQIITLTPASDSDCESITKDNVPMYRCVGGRTFRSARERWWYIAASHCLPATPVGIQLKYKIHMTNGQEGDFLHREYSADEFYIFPIDIAFLIVYVLLSILTIICAVFLRNRQLWHTTYKMFMTSVILWTFYLMIHSIGYGVYGNDGLEYKLRATKYAARAFESISVMVFLLMLILIAKGYTITRGKLSNISTIKITIFMTIYAVVYVAIFIYEAIVFDPGLVLYLYESPPGYGLIVMRIIGYLWFCYAIFFTLKHYPEKGSFYYPLFIFYTLWFISAPIVIIVASNAIDEWFREKTVHGTELAVAMVGHVFFLILTRPSAANKNFPYHVRTTQIGIMNNAPHVTGSGAENMDNAGYGGHSYAVSNPMQGSSSGPDLTSLFTVSHSKSQEGETTFNNNSNDAPPVYSQGAQRRPTLVRPRRLDSTAHLIGSFEEEEQDDFPASHDVVIPSAPPPTYERLFQAQPNGST